MVLFKRVREDPKRKERLVSIRRTIESGYRFEEEAMSKPLNASSLKRLYNIDSLWVAEGDDIMRIGSANYSRELSIFSELKVRYSGMMDSVMIQRGGVRYYVLQKGARVYAFSSPIDLMHSDIMMLISELEGPLSAKNVFLTSSVNITANNP